MKKFIFLPLVFFCSHVIAIETTTIDNGIEEEIKTDTTRNELNMVVENQNNEFSLSIQELVLGKIAGLNTSQLNGDPGSPYKFQSRGASSVLNQGDHPLVFLDDMPVLFQPEEFGNFLNSINPVDIESIEFLKNAADIALYGYQAGNGVLIIRSKEGISKKPLSVSFDNSVLIFNQSNKVDVLNAKEYKTAMNTYLPSTDSEYLTMLGNSGTDWQEEVLRSTFGNRQYLTVSGFVGETSYRVSGGHDEQKGVLKNSDYGRWTTQLNLNRYLFQDKLKLNFGFATSRVDHSVGNLDAYYAAMRFNPSFPVSIKESEEYSDNVNSYIRWGNPLDILNNSKNEIDQRNWNINFKAEYDVPFISGVKAEVYLGKNASDDRTYSTQASQLYAASNIIVNTNANTFNLNSNLFKGGLNYQKKFDGLISDIYVSAGYIKQTDRLKFRIITASNSINTDDFELDNFGFQMLDEDHLNSFESYFNLSTEYTYLRSKLESLYGRLSIELMDRLSISGNYRMDTDEDWNKKVYSGSVGVAYQLLNKEVESSIVNGLGIRMGYGLIGKSTDSDLQAYMNRIHASNFGIDMSFFNHRLQAVFEGYVEKSKNLPYKISVFSGYDYSGTRTVYGAQLENKGVELTVTAVPIVSKNINWTLHFNANYNKNELKNLEYNLYSDNTIAGFGGLIQLSSSGEALNSYNVYKQVYNSKGKPIEGVYGDVNGDGNVDYDDRRIYKNSQPKVLIGFSSNIQYKNWDVNFKLRSAIGNYVYNNIDSYMGTFGMLPNNGTKNVLHTKFIFRQPYSDYYVQKASFVRMENLTVGYSFNQLLGKDIKARIYAEGKNLFTVTNYKGLNPDAPNGIDYNNYPQPNIFALGLKLDF